MVSALPVFAGSTISASFGKVRAAGMLPFGKSGSSTLPGEGEQRLQSHSGGGWWQAATQQDRGTNSCV